MSILHGNYGSGENVVDRRNNKLRFDRSINLGNVLTALVMVSYLFAWGNRIVDEIRQTSRRVDAMWAVFKVDHPDIAKVVDQAEGK